ncbi:MAG TPA: hypothetical protein VEJ86_03195 [Candidatus Binataceae bacterium]|nr:hypothetical protein [Candidatus Binataceae bacterium]
MRRALSGGLARLAAVALLSGYGAACAAGGIASIAGPAVVSGAATAGSAAEDKLNDRGVGGPPEEQNARCDALSQNPPGVEQIRKDKDGSLESREWRITEQNPGLQWSVLPVNGAPSDGWLPKPNIDRLGFSPPLEPMLDVGASVFLVYAPETPMSIPENSQVANLNAAFDSTVGHGTFKWRNRLYAFELADKLPCYPLAGK